MTLLSGANKKKSSGFPILTVFSILVFLLAMLIFGIELVRYSEYRRSNEDTLTSNVAIGGVDVSNLDSDDIRERLETVYVQQPIILNYGSSPIIFRPSEIGFTLDTDAMLASAQRDENFWAGFWDFLWRRPEGDVRRSDRVEVDLIASYARIDLEEYLIYEIAQRYDTTSSTSGFDVGTLTFQGSASSTNLDIDKSIELIDKALYDPNPNNRRIDLPLMSSPGSPPTMEDLRAGIINYLNLLGIPYNGTTTVISVSVIDLETGEEMGILERVPHSASSTIKVGALINYFRYQTIAPTDDVKLKLANMVICSDNGDANNIIDLTRGDGDSYQGLRNTNDTMCKTGAVNSFIRSRLFIGNEGEGSVQQGYYTIVGPPNCPARDLEYLKEDTSVNANADNLLQTTAFDMGTMLSMIYQCAKYNSGLRAVFPNEITQTECEWMLELLTGTRFLRLAELGIPEGVDFAHKIGYGGINNTQLNSVADAGIVFSPGGDYIFVMYAWEADLPIGTQALQDRWDLVASVSRIVYNYFNPDAPLLQNREPVNPVGGAGCVLPSSGTKINFSNIDENRYDENGIPLPSACYGGLIECRQFSGWTY